MGGTDRDADSCVERLRKIIKTISQDSRGADLKLVPPDYTLES